MRERRRRKILSLRSLKGFIWVCAQGCSPMRCRNPLHEKLLPRASGTGGGTNSSQKSFPNPLTDHLFFSSRSRARADTSSQEQVLCWLCCSISGNLRAVGGGGQCTFLRNEGFLTNIYGSASMPCSFHHIHKDTQQECLGKPEMTQIEFRIKIKQSMTEWTSISWEPKQIPRGC